MYFTPAMRVHVYLALFVSGLLACWLHAETFEVADGQSLSGEAVSFGENGVVIKLDDGSYADRIDWGKLTQDALRKLATNPKAAPFANAYIEPSSEESAAAAKHAEIVIRTDYAKLGQSAKKSFIGALFGSLIGVLCLLLIYGGNIYAAYEVSVFRNRPAALVCGVAAVLPIVGPIIFLCMPAVVESREGIINYRICE